MQRHWPSTVYRSYARLRIARDTPVSIPVLFLFVCASPLWAINLPTGRYSTLQIADRLYCTSTGILAFRWRGSLTSICFYVLFLTFGSKLRIFKRPTGFALPISAWSSSSLIAMQPALPPGPFHQTERHLITSIISGALL